MLQDRNYLRQLDSKTLAQVILSQLHPTEFEVAAAEMLEDHDQDIAKLEDEYNAQAGDDERKIRDLEEELELLKNDLREAKATIDDLETSDRIAVKPAA